MSTSMMCAICITTTPSEVWNDGRRLSMDPNSTMPTVAPQKQQYGGQRLARIGHFSRTIIGTRQFTRLQACLIYRIIFQLLAYPHGIECTDQYAYQGAGNGNLQNINKVMSYPASILNKATVAAEIGLAVIACWEAMTAIPIGRSGRIPVSRATSAMTGSTE